MHAIETDREMLRVHLAAQSRCDGWNASATFEDPNSIVGLIGRREKRESLNVVPMGMRDEQIRLNRLIAELHQQIISEIPNAASGIENEQVVESSP